MKKYIFILFVLSSGVCFADQLDGLEIIIKILSQLIGIGILTIGLTLSSGYRLIKGKRKDRSINIRSILAIAISILPSYSIPYDIKYLSIGILIIVMANSIILAINNKVQHK